MQKNNVLLLIKFKNTESAQLCIFGACSDSLVRERGERQGVHCQANILGCIFLAKPKTVIKAKGIDPSFNAWCCQLELIIEVMRKHYKC